MTIIEAKNFLEFWKKFRRSKRQYLTIQTFIEEATLKFDIESDEEVFDKLVDSVDLVSRAEQKKVDAEIVFLSGSCCEHEDPTCTDVIIRKILNS